MNDVEDLKGWDATSYKTYKKWTYTAEAKEEWDKTQGSNRSKAWKIKQDNTESDS